ncbi:hypothetical protein JKP88DRAFT_273105 [Tribonema minus]|uniref:Uncharacterized protein n=1 Tax=Tribonema minus TaxID=303371 RepID=A0A835Z006_9STRA|nr:hypothetical protein JKP88DRAFT_273105 [Tribonema minus]
MSSPNGTRGTPAVCRASHFSEQRAISITMPDILQTFAFGTSKHDVRIIEEDGTPLLLASDVAKVLGLTNIRKSIEGFGEKQRGLESPDVIAEGDARHARSSAFAEVGRAARPQCAARPTFQLSSVADAVTATRPYLAESLRRIEIGERSVLEGVETAHWDARPTADVPRVPFGAGLRRIEIGERSVLEGVESAHLSSAAEAVTATLLNLAGRTDACSVPGSVHRFVSAMPEKWDARHTAGVPCVHPAGRTDACSVPESGHKFLSAMPEKWDARHTADVPRVPFGAGLRRIEIGERSVLEGVETAHWDARPTADVPRVPFGAGLRRIEIGERSVLEGVESAHLSSAAEAVTATLLNLAGRTDACSVPGSVHRFVSAMPEKWDARHTAGVPCVHPAGRTDACSVPESGHKFLSAMPEKWDARHTADVPRVPFGAGLRRIEIGERSVLEGIESAHVKLSSAADAVTATLLNLAGRTDACSVPGSVHRFVSAMPEKWDARHTAGVPCVHPAGRTDACSVPESGHKFLSAMPEKWDARHTADVPRVPFGAGLRRIEIGERSVLEGVETAHWDARPTADVPRVPFGAGLRRIEIGERSVLEGVESAHLSSAAEALTATLLNLAGRTDACSVPEAGHRFVSTLPEKWDARHTADVPRVHLAGRTDACSVPGSGHKFVSAMPGKWDARHTADVPRVPFGAGLRRIEIGERSVLEGIGSAHVKASAALS